MSGVPLGLFSPSPCGQPVDKFVIVSGPASMKSFFEPASIAVVGVSTDASKLASIIFSNLLENQRMGVLNAAVYPLNPSHPVIRGQKCYPNIRSLPQPPELVIVAVPANLVLEVVKEASAAGAKAAILVTGGFAESGKRGLERQLREAAMKSGMRILGPNTIGVLDTASGVDSLFLRPTKRLKDGSQVVSLLKPLKGGVAVITQSGHLGEIVAEELAAMGVGLRALVGTGNQLDVSVEDVIEYFASDSLTKVIGVYLEGVRDGRRFLRATRAASKSKPVIVFKMGKTRAGARAAVTHTASLVGDYDVYRAAFDRAGLIEAGSLQELVDFCVVFSLLERPLGKRLLISTNAGGVGAIASDEAERNGLAVRAPSSTTRKAIRSRLDAASLASTSALKNPLDLTATVSTRSFADATSVALASRDYDMALVLPTHQTPSIEPEVSSIVGDALLKVRKPSCVCVMGSAELATKISDEFLSRGIPSFPTPERSVRALAALASYDPAGLGPEAPQDSESDRVEFTERLGGALSVKDVGAILKAYEIAAPGSVLVGSTADLGKASGLRKPVACKLIAPELPHKSDSGGVILGLSGIRSVESAVQSLFRLANRLHVRPEGVLVQEMVDRGIEAILGTKRDPVFGPVIVFGSGGKFAELFRDYSLALAPLTEREAARFVASTSVGRMAAGYRGGPRVDLRHLSQVISRFSRVLSENPSLDQLEINPLILSAKGIMAVDGRATARLND